MDKVVIASAWVEHLSDEDLQEKLLVQEELNQELKKQFEIIIPRLLSSEEEIERLRNEVDSLRQTNKSLCDQIESCRCIHCYVDLPNQGVI